MDDKDLKKVIDSQLLDDFEKFYSFMLNCKGSEVWLHRIHGRVKGIEEKINFQTPLLLQYEENKESEIKELKEKLKAKDAVIQGLKKDLEKEKAEKELYKEYSKELDLLCDTLEQKRKENLKNDSVLNYNSISNKAVNNSVSNNNTNKQHSETPITTRGGKALELPPRVVREVLRLYCLGLKIKDIAAKTGAERRQIKRIITGDLKHPKSKEKVLKAVNKLLQVNQNKDFISKLEEIKKLYS